LKDGFGPCRGAALQTLTHTANVFSPEELAQRLMPGICQRLVDPEPGVADLAFATLTKLQETVRQMMSERRQTAAAEAGAGPPQADPNSATSWTQSGGSFYNPLAHLSMDKVRQKILSSMGQSKVDGTSTASPLEASDDRGHPAPSPPPPQPGAAGSGMRLGGASAKTTASGSGGVGSSLDLGLDDDGGGGWGDDDDDLFGHAAAPAPVAAPATDLGDDFFDEFEDPPAPASATKAPSSGMSLGGSKVPAPKPTAPKAASVMPKAAIAPKAKSEPAMKLDDVDDDFWKEFDM